MNYIGDFPEDFTTVTVLFSTHDANGAPVAPLSGFEAADVAIYKNGSAAQKTSTNGLTMTSPFDSIVGLHCLVIDTSNDTGDASFWVTGATYSVVLSPDTETVNGQTVVKVLATFGICLAPALRPTTAGRTLDVSATGEAGLDWANVGSPTTTLDLSGTTIKTTQVVGSVTGAVGSIASGGIASASFAAGAINAAAIAADAITDAKVASDVTIASVTGAVGSVTGNVGGSVASIATGGIAAASFAAGAINAAAIAADAIGASELAADAVTEIQSGLATAAALATVQADTDDIQTRLPAALVGGRIDASIGAVASGVIAAASFASGALDAVWSTATRLLTAGTNIALAKGTGVTGFNDLSAAQVNAEADTALSDVGLTTTITGRIDAAVSTRLASAGYTAPDNSTITAIAGYIDTEVAAIKAKTDTLPAAPAAVGDIPTANQNADALLDRANGVESGWTLRQAARIILSALAGKASGMATTTAVFRDLGDSKARITATVDADGNWSAVTLDAS